MIGPVVSPLDVEAMLAGHGRATMTNPVPVVVVNPEALGLVGGAASGSRVVASTAAAAAARRSTRAVVAESLRHHGRVMEPREISLLDRLIPAYLLANGFLAEVDVDEEEALRKNIAELARQVRNQRNADVAANNRQLEQLRRELEQQRRQLAQLQRRG